MDDNRSDTAKLKAIYALWQQYPGRAPGGSGPTGIEYTSFMGGMDPNIAQEWSDILNQQTEALNLSNKLQGKPSVTVRQAPFSERHIPAMRGLQDAGTPEPWSLGRGMDNPYSSAETELEARKRQSVGNPASPFYKPAPWS
jgi:hypothetical protein